MSSISHLASTLVNTIHHIDIAITFGEHISPDSMACIDLEIVEERLHALAERIGQKRRVLLAQQPSLPFLQAAE